MREGMEGKFHIEQPDQSKEARFLGISTREEINRKLSQINSDIVINPNTKGYESTLKFPHQESNRVEISPEEYDLFREEFNTDVRLFSDRIQRLKMRALDQYLAGSTAAISKEEGELSYDQEKLTFIGKLRETAAKLKFKKEKITEDEFKNLVSEANRRLPNGQAIRPIKEPLKIDAEQIYSLTFSMQYGKPPSKERGKMLEGLIEDINEIESELSVIEQQGELFSDKNKNPISEEKFEDLWDKYRELLKRVANIEELTSWHSPTYGTSGKGERGVEQRSEKFLTDYQRWKMWEALELERRLHSDSFGKRVRSGFDLRMESILTNSGMTALEAIMQGIDMRSSRGKKSRKKAKIFKTKDIYFEADRVFTDHYEQMGIKPKEFNPEDTDTLIERIKKDHPLVVFVNPMSNMYDMKVCEIGKILTALCDEEWEKECRAQAKKERPDSVYLNIPDIHIIIDNSTLGQLAKWKNFDFGMLPKFVKIFSFESLVKYGQDGQDLVQAGLITAIGEYASESVDQVRKEKGLQPPENTIRKLAASPPPEITDAKMQRHSRNSEHLTAVLAEEAKNPDSFIAEVIFPGHESHSQFEAAKNEMTGGGGLLNIGFRTENLLGYQEKHETWSDKPMSPYELTKKEGEIIGAFNALIILLAKKINLEVNKGTSYGFRTTRIAIYERKQTEKEKAKFDHEWKNVPYLRVATGTENIKDNILLAEIIKRANQIFKDAIKRGKLLSLVNSIQENKEQGVVMEDV